MSRFTTTRARVRSLADSMWAGGVEPTPTGVLRRLGTGSPNTVVDELRKWRSERSLRSVSAVVKVPAPFDSPAAPTVLTRPPAARHATLQEPVNASQLATAVTDLASRVDHISTTVERFDALQKRLMLQLDDARGQARYWEEEARRLRTDGREREEAYRRGMNDAQSKADVFSGRLAELRVQLATLQKPNVGSNAAPAVARDAGAALAAEGLLADGFGGAETGVSARYDADGAEE